MMKMGDLLSLECELRNSLCSSNLNGVAKDKKFVSFTGTKNYIYLHPYPLSKNINL